MLENDPLKEIWADDCLDRKKTADFLTNYLEGLYKYAKTRGTNKTFVLNLNARWGFGKTYFMTRWKESLEQAGHPVVYFDAWENDYTADPLLGFISQIDEAVGLIVNKSPKVKRALKSMIKSAAPLLMEIAVKRLTHMSLTEIDELRGGIADEEANRKVGEKVGSSVSKTVEKALKDHKAIRKTIKDFKAKLAALCLQIESQISGKQLPLFIFIDELDRCKPTYALQLLEHIKHLFGVDGVYFVISTDSAQLSESIKAIYGGGFDSHMYLKRFFDQQYLLPDPEGENYAKFLYGKYGLETDINLLSPIDPIFCKNSSPSVQLFVITARAFGASLRTQEQACIALRSIRISMGNNPTHGAYCLFLIFAFIQHPVQFTEYCESCEGSQSLIHRDSISNMVSKSVGFPTLQFGESGSRRDISVSVADVFFIYDTAARSDRKKLQNSKFKERIKHEIENQISTTDGLNQYHPDQVYPVSFLQYSKYVRRAGQLM